MRLKPELEEYRVRSGMWRSKTGDPFGSFRIRHKANELTVMAYDGEADGWEHVSVSLKNRCPNWDEMCLIKDLFWDEEEAVMQFHPPRSEYVNMHPFCLHMWRPTHGKVELPPTIAVGVKGITFG